MEVQPRARAIDDDDEDTENIRTSQDDSSQGSTTAASSTPNLHFQPSRNWKDLYLGEREEPRENIQQVDETSQTIGTWSLIATFVISVMMMGMTTIVIGKIRNKHSITVTARTIKLGCTPNNETTQGSLESTSGSTSG
ncbi:unnamed protein product [Orchesella dallaii]|uniref:Uncharacterized protein n=1 Tax=Orchesella dallaii TaxID=48710 RepID=A0ABP1R908_9HEXA